MNVDIFANCSFQFFDASENSAANPLVGDLRKPALHEINPRTVSGREMDMKAWSFRKPVPNHGRLVGSVVIHNDMHIDIAGHIGLDGVEKLPKFLRTMTAMYLANDAVGFQLQSRKQ